MNTVSSHTFMKDCPSCGRERIPVRAQLCPPCKEKDKQGEAMLGVRRRAARLEHALRVLVRACEDPSLDDRAAIAALTIARAALDPKGDEG